MHLTSNILCPSFADLVSGYGNAHAHSGEFAAIGGRRGGGGRGGGEEEPRYILVYLLYAKVFKTCVPHGDRCNLCA